MAITALHDIFDVVETVCVHLGPKHLSTVTCDTVHRAFARRKEWFLDCKLLPNVRICDIVFELAHLGIVVWVTRESGRFIHFWVPIFLAPQNLPVKLYLVNFSTLGNIFWLRESKPTHAILTIVLVVLKCWVLPIATWQNLPAKFCANVLRILG